MLLKLKRKEGEGILTMSICLLICPCNLTLKIMHWIGGHIFTQGRDSTYISLKDDQDRRKQNYFCDEMAIYACITQKLCVESTCDFVLLKVNPVIYSEFIMFHLKLFFLSMCNRSNDHLSQQSSISI